MASDSIGDRMKGQYEDRTRFMLPRRTYTVIRCDGKAFHTFTRQCNKPWDEQLGKAFNTAAKTLCQEAQGSAFAYLQSDEISVLLTDFATPQTCAWFDGNVQKICSVSASIVTMAFNVTYDLLRGSSTAIFDARVWTIPDPTEVENYFIWRQQDATRNSIQSLAQAHFPHRELQGLNNDQLQEKLWSEKQINWNDSPVKWKRGRCVFYSEGRWFTHDDIPVFTQDRDFLRRHIPRYESLAGPNSNG